jgi:hypothetical protein
MVFARTSPRVVCSAGCLPVVKSVTLRYYGSTGGAKLSKGMTFDGNVAKTTITVPAALGATVTYYVDVRTEDNLGTPIKSGTITATITQ